MPLYEYEKYEAFFDEVDEDSDDLISVDDFLKACDKYKYRGSQARVMWCFDEANSKRNGKLSYEEYMTAMGFTPRDRKPNLLLHVFRQFDKDGDGAIDVSELDQVFKEMNKNYSKEQIQRMIALVDKDASGTLNFKEFLKALEQGAKLEQTK